MTDLDRFTWSGDHPYCRAHESHYCPCLKPERYDPTNKKDQEYIRGWAAIAPIVVFEWSRPEPERTVNDPVEIPDGQWEVIVGDAAEKDKRSNQVAWTRRWSEDFNLLGEIGEWLFSHLTGIPRKRGFGDGGEDFPGVDVKCRGDYHRPALMRNKDEPLRTDFYVLAAADLENHVARYCGYATRQEFDAAGTVVSHGHVSRILRERDLKHRDLPPMGGA